MVKNNRRVTAPVIPGRRVRLLATNTYHTTVSKYENNDPVTASMLEFIDFKRQTPLAPFGSKDYPFKHDPLKRFMHAGLTFNVSVVYTISGSNPNVITLYGIFSHDEMGVGNPGSKSKQLQTYKRLEADKARGATPLTKLDERAKR